LGPERLLQLQAVEQLKSKWVTDGFEETDFARFHNPTEEESQTLLEALRTLPFGSERRLVVVEGLKTLAPKHVPWLEAYLNHPNPKTLLVICAEAIEEKRGGFSPAALRSKGIEIIECYPPKGRALQDWLVTQARQLGKQLEPQAATLLMARAGANLKSLSLALESLSLLVDSAEQIRASDVEALIPPSYQETAFEILDTAASGKMEDALRGLHQGIALERISIEQFFGAMGWYYRMAWKTRQGGAAARWMSPARQAALSRLARWPVPKLEKALADAMEADSHVKYGHPTPELLADQLLMGLGS